MENFRLFVGVAVSNDVIRAMTPILSQLSASLPFKRWTHPADLHVTLHFLGDVAVNRVENLYEAMARIAQTASPFRLQLGELATFGQPDAPRVLWCKVSEPAPAAAASIAASQEDPLASLHDALATPLASAGFALEARPFRAHVTLARNGNAACGPAAIAAAWSEATAQSGAVAPLAWTAERVTVFRTHIGRRPGYERLAEFPLRGAL
ncbi:RNA 2',3'-cyclic phosphodiesterase [Cohnella faecalis]|uniref:RNA 2',3'-cyclic phosphodiesterase n=1 Tax=Cohnella faecalis TaxID=2315694 RepID=A0A398CTM4_9BACL|nr:RNA 2',3'-cyclic phosphodiesterase [Cohnella faecalis]RIE04058.1 RNA 2',3'-cyclic phosphodiesterase [Cohnella faecalis]